MKTVLSVALLALVATAAQAEIVGPDMMHTDVICRNTSRLPSGLSITIRSGGIAGMTLAQLTNRDGLGPFQNLGSIAVKREQTARMGAPVHYVGENFDLDINVDGPETDGYFYSHVYADVNGRVLNEPMECEFLAHTL